MYRIDRQYILKGVADTETRKAIAFAIYMKNIKPASIIKDRSYKTVAQMAGISINTCRKRIRKLFEMGLVSEFHRKGKPYLKFRGLRSKTVTTKRGAKRHIDFLDSDISKIDFTSIKTIELGLRAMVIVEIQKRKDWYAQVTIKGLPAKVVKRIKKKLCGRSVDSISDDGISYSTIAKRTGSGRGTVTRMMEYGEEHRMFRKVKQAAIQRYVGRGRGAEAAEYLQCSYHTFSNLYLQPANRFLILGIVP